MWETSLSNRLEELMRAIESLDRCLEQWGADANARYLASLAVEELGTNIIKYGYDDAGEHVIHLRARRENSTVTLCLEDDGHPFNPCATPEPDPELPLSERKPGGWGLSLVRRLTLMQYERRERWNVVCVTMPLVGPADS